MVLKLAPFRSRFLIERRFVRSRPCGLVLSHRGTSLMLNSNRCNLRRFACVLSLLVQGIFLKRVPFLPIRDLVTVRVSSIRYCLIFKVRAAVRRTAYLLYLAKPLLSSTFLRFFCSPLGALCIVPGCVYIYYRNIPRLSSVFPNKIFQFFRPHTSCVFISSGTQDTRAACAFLPLDFSVRLTIL